MHILNPLSRLRSYVAGDQLPKGAALGAVQIAELFRQLLARRLQ